MTTHSRPMKPEQCDLIWHSALPAVSDERRQAAVSALGDSPDDGTLASALVNEFLHLEKVIMVEVNEAGFILLTSVGSARKDCGRIRKF